MKAVSFERFVKMPAGTIFSYWKPCVADGLHRKGESIFRDDGRGFDFYYSDLLPSPGSIQERLDAGEDIDQPVFVPDTETRWGLHEYEQIFAVYEPDDLARLVALLTGSDWP